MGADLAAHEAWAGLRRLASDVLALAKRDGNTHEDGATANRMAELVMAICPVRRPPASGSDVGQLECLPTAYLEEAQAALDYVAGEQEGRSAPSHDAVALKAVSYALGLELGCRYVQESKAEIGLCGDSCDVGGASERYVLCDLPAGHVDRHRAKDGESVVSWPNHGSVVRHLVKPEIAEARDITWRLRGYLGGSGTAMTNPTEHRVEVDELYLLLRDAADEIDRLRSDR